MHRERRSQLHVSYLLNLCNSTHIYYKILLVLMAFIYLSYHSVLTRHAYQSTNKNVRFKAQTYTDRGPTTKFKNEYNEPVICVEDK